MALRVIARRFGQLVHCHKSLAFAQVTATMTMQQAVQSLTIDEQRAIRSWLTQNGPFWEDARIHSPDEWLEFNGGIVTDTAVGEAAWCQLNGIDRELISVSPSNWTISPLPIEWTSSSNEKRVVNVLNCSSSDLI